MSWGTLCRPLGLLPRLMSLPAPRHAQPLGCSRPAASRRGLTSLDAGVDVCSIAAYIHQQTDFSFDCILPKIYELVDVLEYPNSGSATVVTKDDAIALIEDIGASPAELDLFLAEDKESAKAVALIQRPCGENTQVVGSLRRVGLETSGSPSARLHRSEELPTEDLMAMSKRDALGIWYQLTSKGKIMWHSYGGSRMPVGIKHVKQHPVDPVLNAWFNANRSDGWKPCGLGWCLGQHPPAWFNVHEEDPPTLTPKLRRDGCAGYCRRARKESTP